MADDISVGQAIAVAALGSLCTLLIVGASFWAMEGCHAAGRLAMRAWRWLRVRALGGVTTLRRPLSYNYAMCQYSLDAHEEVRTLSCSHVFHCRRERDKCRDGGIDRWLVQESMVCPICRKTPFPVLPWKARPPSSPPPSGLAGPPPTLPPRGLEETLPSPGLADRLLQSAVIAVDN